MWKNFKLNVMRKFDRITGKASNVETWVGTAYSVNSDSKLQQIGLINESNTRYRLEISYYYKFDLTEFLALKPDNVIITNMFLITNNEGSKIIVRFSEKHF